LQRPLGPALHPAASLPFPLEDRRARPSPAARVDARAVTYEELIRSCSQRRYVTVCEARAVSRLAPPAGAARLLALENTTRSLGGCRATRCDGAPRAWPPIPMAWASARGIASKCRWPLRRGSNTRFGGGTSAAPPSQERRMPARCYGSPPSGSPCACHPQAAVDRLQG
jgi:hypothetical protein